MRKSLTIPAMAFVTVLTIAVIVFQAAHGIGAPAGGIEWSLRLASITGALACGWHIALRNKRRNPKARQMDSDAP